MNLMWAPGQSDAVSDICRHLSQREKAGLYGLNFSFGLCCFAIPMIFMGSFMGLGPFPEWFERFTFPMILGLGVVAYLVIVLQRRLLLGTQVAKDKGYTLADITTRQPLSRRDNLIMGGIAALAMAIALAGVLAAFLISA